MPQDQDLIAKFLAEKGATQVGVGVAYGVNAEADKAKRRTEREQAAEHRAERYAEDVREAYHVGGCRAAHEVMNGGRY